MNPENLNPIRPGQTGRAHPAAKPKSAHRSKTISIRVTEEEFREVAENAKKLGKKGLSISKYSRRMLGLET